MPEQARADLVDQARSSASDTVRILLGGNINQTATVVINQGRDFKYLTKTLIKDTLVSELNAAVAEWQNRKFIHSENNATQAGRSIPGDQFRVDAKNAIEAIALVLDA